MRKLILVLILSFASICMAHHAREAEQPFQMEQLTENVYVLLFGRGGNVGFVVGPDAVLVIDSQFPDMAPGIVDQIKRVTNKPIKYLLNTHYHGDHVGGNEHFAQFALILAHDNVRKRMLSRPKDVLEAYPTLLEEARKAGKEEDAKWLEEQIEWAKKVKIEEIAAPVMTYASEFRIHFGDEVIHVWHTPPAHTDGDSVVFLEKANVLHMGDLFFHQIIPFIDTDGGGSSPGYVQAIDAVIARAPANVRIIPGHGKITDLGGLKGLRAYITELNQLAENAKKSGKTKEQFLQEGELPAYKNWDGYEKRFKQNLEAAFEGIL